MSYSIYKIKKIEDICSVASSKRIYASEYVDAGVAFWRSKEVIQKANNEEISDVLYITKERFKEIKMKFGAPIKGDILLASIGANMGTSYYVNIDTDFYFKDGNVTWFNNFSENIYSKYLYFCLNWNIVKANMLNTAIGSAQKALTIESLKKLEIPIPKLDEQKAIAKILSDLDEKIETNNKINKKLEEMAQAIFKQWFVDFEFPNEYGKPYKSSSGEMVESELGIIPKGWKVGSIYEVANVIYGAPFSSKKFNEDKIGLPLIRIRDLKTAKPSFYTEEKHKNATKVKTGDILVGMDAEFTPTIWRGNEGYLNQRVCMFKSNKDYLHDYFIYEIIKPYMNLMEFSKVGTTVIHLGKGDIDNMKIVIPKRDILKLFYKIIDPIYSKLIEVANENRILTDLRDTLLPKLMSGEIRVPID